MERGLFGVLIVEEAEPPPFSRDLLWVLDDWRLDETGQIGPAFNTPGDLRHEGRWGDGNGRSHVKAAIVGPSLSTPVSGKEPLLGTWQQVVLLELDVRQGRTRTIVVTVTG